MQQVTFPVLPKVPGDKHLDRALSLLRKIDGEDTDLRALRRWVRSEGFYDKASFEDLLAFLGVTVEGKRLVLGPLARRLLGEHDAETRQDVFFEYLAGRNEILAKYVFDALAERLYSTSELYRMLTSYVYPGTYIDLPHFQRWLNWVTATGRCKVLGIRWALGQRYEASQSYIASIDVDDILDEEAEMLLAAEPEPSAVDNGGRAEAEADTSGQPADAVAQAVEAGEPPATDEPVQEALGAGTEVEPALSAEAAQTASPVETAEAVHWDPPANASEVPAPTPASAAPVQTPVAGWAPVSFEARLLDPAPQLAVLAAGAPLEQVRRALEMQTDELGAWGEPSPEQVAANVQSLLSWWGEVAERPALRADQHGLMPYGEDGWEDGSRGCFLFRLTCLAVNLCRRPDGDVAFGVLDQAGFFSSLYRNPGSSEQLIDELFEQGLGGREELFEGLHLYLMLARGLRGAEAFCESLADMDVEQALASLWQRLGAYRLNVECLWVARELSMFGLLRQDGLRSLRVVPTLEARQAAFRLGLIPTVRAASLPALIAHSRSLTESLSPELEGPLVALWRAYGDHPPRRFRVR